MKTDRRRCEEWLNKSVFKVRDQLKDQYMARECGRRYGRIRVGKEDMKTWRRYVMKICFEEEVQFFLLIII